jgi:signal transduction histidine kinase/DNA-binding response OmpR family regulator
VSIRLVTVAVRQEQDVVSARQRARQLAMLLGFEAQDQARVATAVSEIARNAFRYAGGGEVEFSIEGSRAPQVFVTEVRDRGPGIANLETVLSGGYRSETGMGLGIVGTRRLMDHFAIHTAPGGTSIVFKKLLPDRADMVTPAVAGRIAATLAAQAASSPIEEVQQQNRELMGTLEELRQRQEELLALNTELEDTNRGVVALYAELEERADFLRRADETKSRFLSSMSHEFRTPLNSIRALTGLLLDRSDGPVNDEQVLQLQLVRKSAEVLAEMVDDLLDLAKIEAGKIDVRPAEFEVDDLFGALRGLLRPLLVSDKVALRFDAAEGLPPLLTDEGKVSQILRNLVSNALKFTERGEIRVTAAPADQGRCVTFIVADTGIGIAPEDHAHIFEEFTQVPGPMQARVKGTGLGLPLCRRLATLLGGRIELESAPGRGSTFMVTLPVRYEGAGAAPAAAPATLALADPALVPILAVEDESGQQLVLDKLLRGTRYGLVRAHTLRQAKEALARLQPAVILLDVQLGHETTWKWLGELKSGTGGSSGAPPVVVMTSVEDPRKSYALGAEAYLAKPLERALLLETLDSLTLAPVLVIDDDPAARYAIRKCLDGSPLRSGEAADAREGLHAARTLRPELIVLDLKLPDRRGEDVLRELGATESTRAIPVVIATSEPLTPELRGRLGGAAAVVGKGDLRREAFGPLVERLRTGRSQ